MSNKSDKIDSSKHLKTIQDAVEEVSTWSEAKLANARMAFSEQMPEKKLENKKLKPEPKRPFKDYYIFLNDGSHLQISEIHGNLKIIPNSPYAWTTEEKLLRQLEDLVSLLRKRKEKDQK